MLDRINKKEEKYLCAYITLEAPPVKPGGTQAPGNPGKNPGEDEDIHLRKLEGMLEEHPDVQKALVTVKEVPPAEKQIMAYVLPSKSRAPIIKGKKRYKLPNNLAVVHLNKNETDYLYREQFEVQAYLKHGIRIHDGDCIFDVGANIGLFALFAHLQGKDIDIYAFEPNPYVYEI